MGCSKNSYLFFFVFLVMFKQVSSIRDIKRNELFAPYFIHLCKNAICMRIWLKMHGHLNIFEENGNHLTSLFPFSILISKLSWWGESFCVSEFAYTTLVCYLCCRVFFSSLFHFHSGCATVEALEICHCHYFSRKKK